MPVREANSGAFCSLAWLQKSATYLQSSVTVESCLNTRRQQILKAQYVTYTGSYWHKMEYNVLKISFHSLIMIFLYTAHTCKEAAIFCPMLSYQWMMPLNSH